MLAYIALLLSFITGGGISTLLTLRYIRKAGKLDYTEKAIAFIEKQYDEVLSKNKDLQDRVETLEKLIPLVCFVTNCPNRLKNLNYHEDLLKS